MTCSCTLQTAQFVAHSFQDLYQKSLRCHPDLQDCLVQFLNEQVLLYHLQSNSFRTQCTSEGIYR